MSENRVLEKHFDTTYNREYYYDPKTQESLWELPEGSKIIDKTSKKEIIKKLQQENIEALYPEFYEDTEILKQNALALINQTD